MTEKLYYEDSRLAEFSARVISCEPAGEGYALTLDRTAFFPEGGGQRADAGYIGDTPVFDARERDGEILHYVKEPVEPGEYACRIDRETRFRRMQNHSGEHILSGIVHGLFGYDNVGFHMGEEVVTIDFDGEMTDEQIRLAQTLANKAVTDNIEIVSDFPTGEELENLNYRSKKELSGEVRIVTIPGVDCCACCAPHVTRTGEIGLIKILSAMRHRGGVRLEIVCGQDALSVFNAEHDSVCAISASLSARREETAEAVERILFENERQKYRSVQLERRLVAEMLAGIPQTDGNICIFDNVLSEEGVRELVNGAVLKCGGLAAVFYGEEGEYKYIMGSSAIDLRALSKTINAGINGRGGGKPQMIQGSAAQEAQNIKDFINGLKV